LRCPTSAADSSARRRWASLTKPSLAVSRDDDQNDEGASGLMLARGAEEIPPRLRTNPSTATERMQVATVPRPRDLRSASSEAAVHAGNPGGVAFPPIRAKAERVEHRRETCNQIGGSRDCSRGTGFRGPAFVNSQVFGAVSDSWPASQLATSRGGLQPDCRPGSMRGALAQCQGETAP
jgi:hypothetical protein